jgi:hypothetical protein
MLIRPVLYLAHPVGGDVDGNLARALRWLAWTRRTFDDVTIIAPWIASVLSGEDDSDPAQREAGLVDCEAVVQLCDAIVLVGGRISSGMERERAVASAVIDWTSAGAEPPAEPTEAMRAAIRDCVDSLGLLGRPC